MASLSLTSGDQHGERGSCSRPPRRKRRHARRDALTRTTRQHAQRPGSRSRPPPPECQAGPGRTPSRYGSRLWMRSAVTTVSADRQLAEIAPAGRVAARQGGGGDRQQLTGSPSRQQRARQPPDEKRTALVTYIELRSNRDFPQRSRCSRCRLSPRRRTAVAGRCRELGCVQTNEAGTTEPSGSGAALRTEPGQIASHAAAITQPLSALVDKLDTPTASEVKSQVPGHASSIAQGAVLIAGPHVPVQAARPRPYARVLAERGRGLSRHRVHHRQPRAELDLRARPWRRADQRHGPGAGPIGGPRVDRPRVRRRASRRSPRR